MAVGEGLGGPYFVQGRTYIHINQQTRSVSDRSIAPRGQQESSILVIQYLYIYIYIHISIYRVNPKMRSLGS